MDRYCRVLTEEEFKLLQGRFGFLPEHGVMILDKGVLILLFEAGLSLPTSNFCDMIVHNYGFSIKELTPSAANKIVGFELIFRSLGCIPAFWVFSYFFCSTTNSGVRTLAKRRGIRQLISEQDSPKKNWQGNESRLTETLWGVGFIKHETFLAVFPSCSGGV